MAARKAGKGGSQRLPLLPPAVSGGIRWALGPGRSAALLVLVAVIFGGGWYLIWRRLGAAVLSSESYWLTPEGVQITPLPEWIHTDIRREVFRDASLDGPLWIMDDSLAARVHDAFAMHPWVARVLQVRKLHPAGLKVDLEYRRPVLFVQVGEERFPVDAEGVLLPGGDFSPTEVAAYPCLVGIETRPATPLGSRWADPRVAGGAEIAATLAPVWEKLQLHQIVAIRPAGPDPYQECAYELVTRAKTRIFWGRAPSSAFSGEPTAAEKLGQLQRYAAQHGTLEPLPPGPPLDLTRPR